MADYSIRSIDSILSPSLVVFEDVLRRNLTHMIEIAGDVSRLRPHVKTHKMPAVVNIELQMGITRHKAATLAEAEMLADCGVPDVFLAYNLVGPNIDRAVAFRRRFPECTFAVTADHEKPLDALSAAMQSAGLEIDVLLDINPGLHRTGVAVGDRALRLYRHLADAPGLNPAGFHFYDGHQHQTSVDERRAAILPEWKQLLEFRDQVTAAGMPAPKIVAGGTGSFPVYAALSEPSLQVSPGTCVFHDSGYARDFPDMPQFEPAALLLTRVISRPGNDLMTMDLGSKAVASDPPMGKRLTIPELPDAEQILQNEEHLVLRSSRANEFEPGDAVLAVPVHICPTSALHQAATVIRDGEISDSWPVVGRDRKLTI